MMRTVLLILGFLSFLPTINAQYVVKSGDELLNLQKVSQEKIYMHHSASTVFAGEYLFYKLYCQNAQTNRLSNVSMFAYVNLIDFQGNVIFEHKLKLKKGMAQGDFFLNTSIPSGNYKLVAYTQWMKNSGLDQIFKDDIVVINPYLADQSALLPDTTAEPSETIVEASEVGEIKQMQNDETPNKLLQLETTDDHFSKREKVVLDVKNYKGNLGHGNYSVLIQKKNNFAGVERLSAEKYAMQYLQVDKTLDKRVGDSIFLPEQRGELFYGQVRNKQTGAAEPNKTVIISIPGKEHLLKSAITDQTGHFYTYIRKDYKNPKAIVQIVDEGDYEIEVKQQKKLDFSSLEFSKFTLNKVYEKDIVARSVRNQIENGFFTVKPDSILAKDEIDVFDGGIPEVFVLAEYTQFPTLQETLIEILNTVGYRDGGSYIRVAQEFEKFNEPYNDYPAIVLIDGVFIPDHSKIRDFDARLITEIKVLRDVLALGSKQFQGLVAIETEKGDYYESYNNVNTSIDDIELPRVTKNYYKQQYNEQTDQGRIPDYRNILLWESEIVLADTSFPITFYTSDMEGEYDIILEGFTTYGKPVSVRKTITVE